MMFSNDQVDLKTLPKVQELQLEPISPKYFIVLVLNSVLAYGTLTIAFTLLNSFVGSDSFIRVTYWYFISFAGLCCVFQILIFWLGFKKREFALREHDIIYAHGFFVYDMTTLPFNRIQHIEISRTFLERQLGLSTLKIYSAGESGGDLSIKGLTKSDADLQYAHLTKIVNERV